jgi:hypothetical protein
MKITGFHASSGKIRYVTLDGTKKAPALIDHGERPLQLDSSRSAFAQACRNLFVAILADQSPSCVAYVLSMDAKSRDQVAGLILPFGVLSIVALDQGKPVEEFIPANFSKSKLSPFVSPFTDKYAFVDQVVGQPKRKWSNQHRLAALAAWMALP